MRTLFIRFARDESGVTAIEYGLVAALIAVAIIGTVTTLGTNVSNKFSYIAGYLTRHRPRKQPPPPRNSQAPALRKPARQTVRAAGAGNRQEPYPMKTIFIRFAADDSGVTAIEYALIAGLIALVIFASVGLAGTNLSARYAAVAGHFS